MGRTKTKKEKKGKTRRALTLGDKIVELPLGHDVVAEIEAAELPHVGLPHVQHIQQPKVRLAASLHGREEEEEDDEDEEEEYCTSSFPLSMP